MTTVPLERLPLSIASWLVFEYAFSRTSLRVTVQPFAPFERKMPKRPAWAIRLRWIVPPSGPKTAMPVTL